MNGGDWAETLGFPGVSGDLYYNNDNLYEQEEEEDEKETSVTTMDVTAAVTAEETIIDSGQVGKVFRPYSLINARWKEWEKEPPPPPLTLGGGTVTPKEMMAALTTLDKIQNPETRMLLAWMLKRQEEMSTQIYGLSAENRHLRKATAIIAEAQIEQAANEEINNEYNSHSVQTIKSDLTLHLVLELIFMENVHPGLIGHLGPLVWGPVHNPLVEDCSHDYVFIPVQLLIRRLQDFGFVLTLSDVNGVFNTIFKGVSLRCCPPQIPLRHLSCSQIRLFLVPLDIWESYIRIIAGHPAFCNDRKLKSETYSPHWQNGRTSSFNIAANPLFCAERAEANIPFATPPTKRAKNSADVVAPGSGVVKSPFIDTKEMPFSKNPAQCFPGAIPFEALANFK